MSGPWKIPATWQWSTMGEVAEVVGGGTPRTSRVEHYGGDIPWITPADLSGYSEKRISQGVRSITRVGLENSGARLMPAGTVLFSSRAPIGYVAIAANPVSTNQGFKSFVLRDGFTPDYVYYYLQHAKSLAVELASGTTFLEISGKKAAQIPIPVAPVDEQHRIVVEIEKQFTRLGVGVAALRRVQANLKRYRAAILKAACEGRLVAGDRTSWRTARLGEAVDILDSRRIPVNSEERAKRVGEVPYYGATGQVGWIDAHIFDEELVLLGEDGAPFLESAKPKAYLIREKSWVNNHAHVLRARQGLLNLFLLYQLNCLDYQPYVSGTTRLKLPQGPMKQIPLLVPPLAEQERIVAEVERRLSVVEDLETVVSANLQRATRLRQSILQRAFEGKLVSDGILR